MRHEARDLFVIVPCDQYEALTIAQRGHVDAALARVHAIVQPGAPGPVRGWLDDAGLRQSISARHYPTELVFQRLLDALLIRDHLRDDQPLHHRIHDRAKDVEPNALEVLIRHTDAAAQERAQAFGQLDELPPGVVIALLLHI